MKLERPEHCSYCKYTIAQAEEYLNGLEIPENIFKTVKPKAFLSVEMSTGQMIEDIKLACECSAPVYFCGRTGGIIPTPDEVAEKVKSIMKEVQ